MINLKKNISTKINKVTNWLTPFLDGVDDEPSSKRLIGVFIGVIFGILCLVGGIHELLNNSYRDFINILEVAALYSGGLLGAGVIERHSKNKMKNKLYRNKERDDASITDS